MMQTQPLEIADFTGGITDYYVNGDLNQYQKGDNLQIEVNKKLLTRPGSVVYDTTNYFTSAGGTRIGAIINRDANTQLFVQQGNLLFYGVTSGSVTTWTELVGPTGNHTWATTQTTSNFISSAEWNKHVLLVSDSFLRPLKVYIDSAGTVPVVRTAGLPKFTATPTATPGTVGTTFSYIYAFVYYYTYTVKTPTGNVTYEDYGPTLQVTVTAANAIAAGAPNTISIASIPALSNSTTDNWDTSNVKVKIYRTTNAGTSFYLVATINNAVTTYSDTTVDATLSNGQLLYTNGGVLDNDPPPGAKYVTVVNNITWYAHIKDLTTNQVYGNRVRQSVAGDPDSCPATLFIDVDQEISGLSNTNGNVVVLCKKGIYRLDGVFDELGRGSVTPRRISETVGCVNGQGVVQTPDGIFFPGLDGFYWTDGYQVQKISEGFNDTYRSLVLTRTQAAYDEKNRRVYWAVQSISGSTDNDSFFVLDIRWGIKPFSAFTTWSGSSSLSPSAITFFNGQLLRADSRGYLLKHDPIYTTDPVIDTLNVPSVWQTQTIIYDYKSCAINFSTNFVRKWVPRITTTCKNSSTNLALQINSLNDDSLDSRALEPIRYTGAMTWGDTSVVWGDATKIWNDRALIEEQRRFPAGTLRCEYKQIEITNALVILYNSDSLGTGTVNNALKTVTLDTVTANWPSDVVNYYISFATDNYVKNYAITVYTPTKITYLDPSASTLSGSVKWVIRGYPKGDVMNLLSYTVHYAPLSKTQTMYKGNQGANA